MVQSINEVRDSEIGLHHTIFGQQPKSSKSLEVFRKSLPGLKIEMFDSYLSQLSGLLLSMLHVMELLKMS